MSFLKVTKKEFEKLNILMKFLIMDYDFTGDLIKFLKKQENQFLFIEFLKSKIGFDYTEAIINNIEYKYNIVFLV